jgi:3-hydroxy-9,10-secoandrosta-1,3,5(10)-triene-9,17-dione monooxygenase reductase component
VTRPAIDPADFRQLLGRFATGVTVVTIHLPDGRPAGMTANSLASVSLDPPLLSLCIDHAAELYAPLQAASGWVVNILEASQESLSRRFAAKHVDRFDGVGYRLSPEGHPILDGVVAWIECVPHATFPGGDHTIMLGRVLGGGTTDAAPLVYFRGGYTDLRRG